MNDNKVTLIGIEVKDEDSIAKYIEDSWEEVLNKKRLNLSHKKVLIKPNIAGPFLPEQAATTSPKVIQAVVELVQKAEGIPVVGDFPTVGEAALEKTGLLELSRKMEFEILRPEYKSVQIKGLPGKINIAKQLEDADIYISLPKIKTHVLTGMTGAIKNTFGLVSPKDRKSMHNTDVVSEFSSHLVSIYNFRQPDLVIADALLAMEGIGPTHGKPRTCSTVFVSGNGAALDLAAIKLMGYKVESIPTARIAVERNYTDIDVEIIEKGRFSKVLWENYQRVPVFEGKERMRFVKMALGRLLVNTDRCKKCGVCVECCPVKAISIEGFPIFNTERCVYCFCCLEMCSYGAIKTTKSIK